MSSHAGHAHGHERERGKLPLALGLTLGVALLELGGGLAARSLALLADSAHVFMDVLALGLAWWAQRQAARPATSRQTYGYARLEILAALGNGALLLAITVLIAVEAVHRLFSPELPSGALMIGVALAGGSLNAVIATMLSHGASKNINVRAAFYHVLGDVLGAIAVAAGGCAVLAFQTTWVDPLLSLLVALLIVAGILNVVREAVDVLLESTPAHVDMEKLLAAMRGVTGVVDVHDLHVWTLGACTHALSAHVLVSDARISEATAIQQALDARVREEFEITHVTMQFECQSCATDQRIVCTQRRG